MRPMIRRNAWLPTVFNDFFDNDFMPRANATAPAINVIETQDEYTVELAAPGLKKEDFNVNINEEGCPRGARRAHRDAAEDRAGSHEGGAAD